MNQKTLILLLIFKGMTGFGCPRDVKGKHLKRIWELEFPEAVQPAVNQGELQQLSNTNIQQQNAPQRQAPPQPPPKLSVNQNNFV